MPVSVAESYALCHQISRRTAKNFYFSFAGLPKPKFQAMCALYAFMRISDDIGDDDHVSIEQRSADLALWTEMVRDHVIGSSGGQGQDVTPSDRRSNDFGLEWEQRSKTLPAIADVVSKYGVPVELLFDVLVGIRSDLEHDALSGSRPLQPQFESFSELEKYCYHVAGVVGLCCVHIWGIRDQRAVPLAIDCGLAFQLTNILRDIGSDAATGRIYLPNEDLTRFGYAVGDLQTRTKNAAFRELMRFEVQRARGYYERALGLFDCIEPVGHPILEAMLKIYGGLLTEIERREFDVYSARVALPRWKKLLIAAEAFAQRHSLIRPHFTDPSRTNKQDARRSS